MTSLPQTQQRTFAAQDGRRRTSPVAPPAAAPSQEFGCVDWFLYPDAAEAEARARIQVETQVKRVS